MDRFKLSKWQVTLGAPNRVNIPCLIRDIRLCRYNCSCNYNEYVHYQILYITLSYILCHLIIIFHHI